MQRLDQCEFGGVTGPRCALIRSVTVPMSDCVTLTLLSQSWREILLPVETGDLPQAGLLSATSLDVGVATQAAREAAAMPASRQGIMDVTFIN